MALTINQRKRLIQLYDEYLALPESQRAAWQDALTGDDAGLRGPLLELLSDREEVLRRKFMESPPFAGTTELGAEPEQTALGAGPFAPSDSNSLGGGPGKPPDTSTPPAVGMVLDDRFELLEPLGEGGMGRVFKARDRLGDPRDPYVAVKVINENIKQFTGADAALRRETDRARLVAHPNVVNVREFHIDERYGFAFMTMEYLRGQTLSKLLSTDYREGMPFDRAWQIIESIGRALANGHSCTWEDERGIHKGIIHRDLKPANVFICHDGRVKVLDFGIARMMSTPDAKRETTLFAKGFVILTVEYASLEMLQGNAPPDPRDDIYAFGCISYEVLTGEHPFGRASAKQALAGNSKPQRPAGLDWRQWRTLRSALAFERADRIPTVAQFLLEFERRSWIRKYAKFVAAAIVAAFVGTAALAYHYMIIGSDEMQEVVPAPVPLNAQQQTTLNDLITRARDRLEDVDITADPERLLYVISDGLDNVDELTTDALEIQPGSQSAREIRAKAAALYAAKAREILKRQRGSESALQLLERGLQIRPHDRTLVRMRKDLCERHVGLCRNGPS